MAGIQTRLSSQLQQQFALRVEISAEEKREVELTLANPSDDRYRLFAMWHVDHLNKGRCSFRSAGNRNFG
jgi:hypothetical protein